MKEKELIEKNEQLQAENEKLRQYFTIQWKEIEKIIEKEKREPTEEEWKIAELSFRGDPELSPSIKDPKHYYICDDKKLIVLLDEADRTILLNRVRGDSWESISQSLLLGGIIDINPEECERRLNVITRAFSRLEKDIETT